MMTAGTGGFSWCVLLLQGPNAGYDPVMKFRKKLKKTKDDKKLVMPGNKRMFSESKENPKAPSKLYQYKGKISLKLVRLLFMHLLLQN